MGNLKLTYPSAVPVASIARHSARYPGLEDEEPLTADIIALTRQYGSAIARSLACCGGRAG
jgi:hypothetical protein